MNYLSNDFRCKTQGIENEGRGKNRTGADISQEYLETFTRNRRHTTARESPKYELEVKWSEVKLVYFNVFMGVTAVTEKEWWVEATRGLHVCFPSVQLWRCHTIWKTLYYHPRIHIARNVEPGTAKRHAETTRDTCRSEWRTHSWEKPRGSSGLEKFSCAILVKRRSDPPSKIDILASMPVIKFAK